MPDLMTRRTSSSAAAQRAGRPPTRPSERDLLAQLGLPESAGPSAIDAAHDDVVAFLETAPTDVRSWALAQIAAADEAYARLSDPAALSEAEQAEVQGNQAQSAVVPPVASPRRIGRLGRLAITGGALAAILTGAYLIYASDIPSVPGLTGTPVPEASQPALDTARVAAAMQTIQSEPENVAALQELADLYFEAGDYATSADWEERLLAVDPDNVVAHLALGAALYNQGNSADAETHWRRVLALEPNNVEAHYDLGFMYFSATPPDLDKAIVEWRRVIEIAPDTDIAQTVSAHLETLEEWEAASAAPSTPASPPPSADSGK